MFQKKNLAGWTSIALVSLAYAFTAPSRFAQELPHASEPPASSAAAQVADLHWLAGTWHGTIQGIPGASRFEASYTTPDGGMVLGTSKAFGEDGRLQFFEFEKFELRDGNLVVTPYPGGRASVSFTLTSFDAAARKAVFSNPEHDFPQEISYQRTADDRVQFLVSGKTENGENVLQIDLARQP